MTSAEHDLAQIILDQIEEQNLSLTLVWEHIQSLRKQKYNIKILEKVESLKHFLKKLSNDHYSLKNKFIPDKIKNLSANSNKPRTFFIPNYLIDNQYIIFFFLEKTKAKYFGYSYFIMKYDFTEKILIHIFPDKTFNDREEARQALIDNKLI